MTARLNLVARAKILMAKRAPVTCHQEFKELVKVLVEGFLTWSKFTAPGLDGCPNLATKSTAKLRISRDAEQIEDLARVVETKRLRVEELDVEVEDKGNGEVVVIEPVPEELLLERAEVLELDQEEPSSSRDDQHLDYVDG